jgi:thiol-disulfide isomerase/thioredoxin
LRRDIVVLIVVIVAVGAMISASVFWSRRVAQVGTNSPGQSAAQADVRGQAAPDFELTSLDGKKVKLSDYRGKAVLLDFWATWCVPCKIEMPWFEELQKQYGPQGLQVLGVAMDDTGQEAVAKFAKDVGASYTIVMGKEAVAEAYGGLQFLPTTVFVGRDGKIVERVFGLVSHSEIEDNIKKSLASKSEAKQTATDATPASKTNPQLKTAATR